MPAFLILILPSALPGERPRRGQLRELRAPQECPQAIADLQQRQVQGGSLRGPLQG